MGMIEKTKLKPLGSTAGLDTRPMVGETWHVLYPGGTVCCTVKIAEITQRTVVFESRLRYAERYPIDKITFIEMANIQGETGITEHGKD
jgi:hypothetical protein